MKTTALLGACCVGLAACASVVPDAGPTAQRSATSAAGLGRVMGQSAAGLVALFGEPAQDFREAPARKLQFANRSCVLDAYLYPQGADGEPVVTHVDTRSPVGEDVDHAACVAALTRR